MYNKHVVKMILETAQLLCTAHHMVNQENNLDSSYVPYKCTHKNHPSSVWVRSSIENYNWAYNHMIALGEEYTKRYSKTHLTITKCKDVLKHAPISLKRVSFSQPPQCMPEQYMVKNDSVKAYWNYYINEKHSVANKDEVIITKQLN